MKKKSAKSFTSDSGQGHVWVYSGLIFVQLLFALNIIATKYIVHSFDALLWAFIRFFASGILLAFFAKLFNHRNTAVNWKYYFKIFIFAAIGVTLGQVAFIYGMRSTSATNASVIASTIPLLTLFFSVLLGKDNLNLKKLVGFFISITGVLILLKIEKLHFTTQTFMGDALILTSAAAIALFLVLSRSFFQKNDYWWATAWIFIVASFQVIPLYFYNYSFLQFTEHLTIQIQPQLYAIMFFSIFGGTLLTYFINNWGLVKIEASKVSLFAYLQPLFAAFLAYFFINETLTLRVVIAMTLILIGFYFALQRKK